MRPLRPRVRFEENLEDDEAQERGRKLKRDKGEEGEIFPEKKGGGKEVFDDDRKPSCHFEIPLNATRKKNHKPKNFYDDMKKVPLRNVTELCHTQP